MSSHLIYHPRRQAAQFGGRVVYFDKTRGNQDPYIWNDRFLHTFCHMTELRSPQIGEMNFWVSGDKFPDFDKLFCDLVFVIEEVAVWPEQNHIEPHNQLVESHEAYGDHYIWASHEHGYKRRIRRTLKGHAGKSFQPQDGKGGLIDIVPYLHRLGQPIEKLRDGLRKGRGTKPKPLDADTMKSLYEAIECAATVKLFGEELRKIRLASSHLASPAPK